MYRSINKKFRWPYVNQQLVNLTSIFLSVCAFSNWFGVQSRTPNATDKSCPVYRCALVFAVRNFLGLLFFFFPVFVLLTSFYCYRHRLQYGTLYGFVFSSHGRTRVLRARLAHGLRFFFFFSPRIFLLPSPWQSFIISRRVCPRRATNHGGSGGATSFARQTTINWRTVERILCRDKTRARKTFPTARRPPPPCPSECGTQEHDTATVAPSSRSSGTISTDLFFFSPVHDQLISNRLRAFLPGTRVAGTNIRVVRRFVYFFVLPGRNESRGRNIHIRIYDRWAQFVRRFVSFDFFLLPIFFFAP